ncbi:MAG: transporter, partial [Candidatus Margulisiibacteriota bacterium]
MKRVSKSEIELEPATKSRGSNKKYQSFFCSPDGTESFTLRFHPISVFLFLMIIIISYIPAWACLPLTVDDCPPTEKGKVGIETGYSSIKLSNYDGNMTAVTSIKYGLINNVDVGIDLPYLNYTQTGAQNVSGLADATVKTKINIIPLEDHFSGLSLTAGAKLSNGDANKGLGSGATDYSINSILTKELNKLTMHLNLGYTMIGQVAGQTLRNVMNYGWAFESPMLAGINLLGEVYGSTNPDPTADLNPLAATIGANKEVFSGLTADAGLSVGL